MKKSLDGLLGIRTRGGRMVGADGSTELWQHPNPVFFVYFRTFLNKVKKIVQNLAI